MSSARGSAEPPASAASGPKSKSKSKSKAKARAKVKSGGDAFDLAKDKRKVVPAGVEVCFWEKKNMEDIPAFVAGYLSLDDTDSLRLVIQGESLS
jgi:hypothetical protein